MKLTTKLFFLAVTLIVALSTPSCKKYEEGPRVSFRSKKARVANRWALDKAYSNGVEMTGLAFESYRTQFGVLELTKDGDVISNSALGTNTGKWEFSNNKENLVTTITVIIPPGLPYTYVETYKILKLKNDELWVEFYDDLNGDTKEVHLKPA